MKCRYCDHGESDHEAVLSWKSDAPRPCNFRDDAARTHCTCYGFNLDFPAGRSRATSAPSVFAENPENPRWPLCENDGDGVEHYKMGHAVRVGDENEPRVLCTRCCDAAKLRGASVVWWSEEFRKEAR